MAIPDERRRANARQGHALGSAALLALSLGVAILVAELTLRVLLPSPAGYYVYPPGLERVFEPRDDLMPGVRGPSRFRVNGHGLRGDELTPEKTRRILAVGGSTTQCLYLDQSRAWPQRLQEILGQSSPGQPAVWVGNAGKAGRRLAEHILQVDHVTPQLGGVDVIVLLVGANDVNIRLGADRDLPRFDPAHRDRRRELLPRAFDLYPWEFAWHPVDRTAVWSLGARVRQAIRLRRSQQMAEGETGEQYQLWRKRRAQASGFKDQLPDLSTALSNYRAELGTILEVAHAHGTRIVFATQPFIYRADLPDEYEDLLWMGWAGERQPEPGQEYYSTAAMAEAYRRYNQTLLAFCREEAAECVDLEPRIPKDTTSFYDDIHFNDSGAEQVARVLAEVLANEPAVRRGGTEGD